MYEGTSSADLDWWLGEPVQKRLSANAIYDQSLDVPPRPRVVVDLSTNSVCLHSLPRGYHKISLTATWSFFASFARGQLKFYPKPTKCTYPDQFLRLTLLRSVKAESQRIWNRPALMALALKFDRFKSG